MDGSRATDPHHDALIMRLASCRDPRLAGIVGDLVGAISGVIQKHRILPSELRAAAIFASDVTLTTDERRNEWVLLSDALGLTALAEASSIHRPGRATAQTLMGPFFRDGAPAKRNGDNLSIDGIGAPLQVAIRVLDLDDDPIAGAQVDVWHANGKGMFENQDPDSQPDFNLRGRFVSDRDGVVAFQTVRPAGYSLPNDGPVAQLMGQLGLSMQRPAHIQFRIKADRFQTLVTHVFDRDDPHVDADPLFCVCPTLLADFGGPVPPDDHILRFTFRLARARPAHSK